MYKLIWSLISVGLFIAPGTCTSRQPAPLKENYKLYTSRDPFYLYVVNQSALLLRSSDRAALRFDRGNDRNAVVASIPGADVSLVIPNEGKANELQLVMTPSRGPAVLLRDLNLDGVWDIKVLATGEKFIMTDSKWIQVQTLQSKDKAIYAITNDQTFQFDFNSGTWVLK